MCLIIYRIRILLDETQVLLLLTFGAITAPLLIQVGLEMSAITLIERVIELWRVFFPHLAFGSGFCWCEASQNCQQARGAVAVSVPSQQWQQCCMQNQSGECETPLWSLGELLISIY